MADQCQVCGQPKHFPETDFGYTGLPSHMRRGFRAYIEGHHPMGHFGMAILRNDLREACRRADQMNRLLLVHIVTWLWSEAPANCWGSPEAVQSWTARPKDDLA